MFEVEWLPGARQHFAEAWRPLDDQGRKHLMNIVERLDSKLRADPYSIGESRDNHSIRVAAESSVAISYRIAPRLELVRVFAVYVFDRR